MDYPQSSLQPRIPGKNFLDDIEAFGINDSVEDLQVILEEIVDLLTGFSPTDIVTGDGKSVIVLGIENGDSTATQELWDLVLTENNPVDTNLKLNIVPGTFGGVIASNHDTALSIPKSGTRYVCFDVTTIDGAVSSMAYSVETALPDPPVPTADAPQTSFKFLFGITVDGVPTKLCGAGIFNAIPIESYRVAKIAPSAGELPYTVYYNWLVRQ